jgi:GTP-binding protein EngB required for normal cell division
MVVGRRAMAYTSKTPGKTQQFNYFNVNGESTFDEPKGEFNLVDLPGVGYAKVPKRVRDEWAKFMTDYFYTRPTLKVLKYGPHLLSFSFSDFNLNVILT